MREYTQRAVGMKYVIERNRLKPNEAGKETRIDFPFLLIETQNA